MQTALLWQTSKSTTTRMTGNASQVDLPPVVQLCNHVTMTSKDAISGWFAGRLPDEWYAGQPTVTVDNEEILVVGPLSAPDLEGDASEEAKTAAAAARAKRFRED